MGLGKTGRPILSPHPPHLNVSSFDLAFYRSVFWIILLFYCIFTLMNDLFHWENQVFKPTSLLVTVEWGKTGPADSFSPQKCLIAFDFYFSLSVFWIMLLLHCILSLINDLFQRENLVFKPTSLLVLLLCGVGKDWVSPIFLHSKMFLSFYFIFSVFRFMLLIVCIWTILNDLFQREIKFSNQQVYWFFNILGWGKAGLAHSFPPPNWFDLSIYLSVFWIMLLFLNTYEWPVSKRESSFPTKPFICTATLWG